MYSKSLKWIELALIAVATTAALVVLLALIRSLASLLWTEKAAGWAQAILTTAGIAFALYTAQGAQKHSETLREQDLEKKRTGVIPIAEAAFDHIEFVEQMAERRQLHVFFADEYSSGYFSHVLTALRAIPLHELSSYNMTVGVLDMINALVKVENFCEKHASDNDTDSLSDVYFSKNVYTRIDGGHALNFIRGGAKGLSTEEIEQQNAAT